MAKRLPGSIALTYGRESQWVHNLLAQGGCELETQGRTVKLTRPRLFHDETRAAVPSLHRRFLTVFGVSDFLRAHGRVVILGPA